jgi:hypothetical protein
MASPVEVLHSRQKRPLIQDDRLKLGDYCAARHYRVIGASGDRKSKTYRGLTRMIADRKGEFLVRRRRGTENSRGPKVGKPERSA